MENSETNTIEEAKPTAALYAALAKAQANLKAVEKDGKYSAPIKRDGKDTGYKVTYNYASAEAVMQAATEAMGDSGLALVCTTWALSGKFLNASYLLTHEGGGSMALGPFMMSIHENKMKPTDKAIATGLTYLQNYATRGIFNIPRVEPGAERDSQHDSEIQAWESEQQKARVKREKAAAAEHKEKRKALKLEGDLIKEHAPPFFAAASLTMDKQTKGAFLLWAANAEAWSRDVDVQIEITAAAAAYLIEWGQMEDVDALQAANDFCRHLTGDVLGNDEAEF